MGAGAVICYESASALSLIERSARLHARATLLRNTEGTRVPGAPIEYWAHAPAATAQEALRESGSDLVLDPATAALCAALPNSIFVLATTVVDVPDAEGPK
ncbi:MAG: hypothetical protein ACEQSX_00385 [Baekduiaceae bacterium]